MKKFCSKISAFTLSEMTIALGIIAVIAALTIPSVIYNVNNRANSALLKKAQVKLNEVVELSLAESRFQPSPKCFYDVNNPNIAEVDFFDDNLKQCSELYKFIKENLRTIKDCESGVSDGCLPEYKAKDSLIQKGDSLSSGDGSEQEYCWTFSYDVINESSAIVTSDGIVLIPFNKFLYPVFAVDVNGKKGPNRIGYDVFYFQLFGGHGRIPSFEPPKCEKVEKGGFSTTEMLNFTKEKFE